VQYIIMILILISSLSLNGCKKSLENSYSVKDTTGVTYQLNDALSAKLASSALRGHQGYSSNRCYLFVWQALKRVLGTKIDSTTVASRSAYQFGEWMDRNTEKGFNIFRLRKLNATGIDIPRGSVIVYKPGQCGANREHGHIEIAVGNGKACSDYCAPIRSCTPSVYAPILPDSGKKGPDVIAEKNQETDDSVLWDLEENDVDFDISTPTIETTL